MQKMDNEFHGIENEGEKLFGNNPNILEPPKKVYRTHTTTPLLRRLFKAIKYSFVIFILYLLFFPIRQIYILNGKVVAKEMRKIDSGVDGELVSLVKSIGDTIKEGEEIGRIHSLPLHQEKDRLEAEIKIFDAQINGLNKNIKSERILFSRYKELFNAGDLSRIKLEQEENKIQNIESAILVKEAEIEERTVRISNINEALKREIIRSPFNGVIVSRVSEKLRSQIKVGDNICIVAYGGLQFEFKVKEDAIRSIQIGQNLAIKIEAFQRKEFEGMIDEIDQIIMEDRPKPWVKINNVRVLVSSIEMLPNSVLLGMTVTSKIILKDRVSNISKWLNEWDERNN